MKKFKLESAKKPEPELAIKPKTTAKDETSEKDKKREQMQKEMKMLQAKITDKESSIKQSQKLLNVDEFLKKQKEKTRQYALKLNQQYDKQKKEREMKLYKKYRGDTPAEKLMTATSKNEIPLNIFSALEQLKQGDGNIKKWILDDHHYKLDDLLLDVSKGQLFGEELKQEEEKCLKSKEENAWRRFKEISTHSAQIKYLPVIIEQNVLESSQYGELLMSALTLMPRQHSEYLYQHRKGTDREQYFICRFYPGGQRKSVITNQWLEVREYTHKYINVGSRHRDGVTFWSSLLEKSYRKLYYNQITPNNIRETISTVYGLDPEIISFSNLIAIRDNFPKVLNLLLNGSPKVCIGFINQKSESPERIYPLLSVDFPVQKKKKKKSSTNIQQQPKEETLYHVSNPYPGVLKSDFVNKFTINELFASFNKIIVLREYPQKWKGVRVNIQFLSNGPISFTNTEWIKNNQYSFTLSKVSQIRLALRRRWGTYLELSQKQQEKFIFGFVLFKSPDGETEISSMKLQNLLSKCKSNDENGCTLSKFLEKGTYILVPFSHYVSQQYMQAFNLDILCERDDVVTVNKAKIFEYFYENKPTNDSKVIQKLQNRVKYERPKNQKIAPQKIYGKTSNKVVTEKQVEALGLTLSAQVKIGDFFIPGKLKPFLVQGEAKQQKREKKQKKSEQAQELQRYERQQALKIMLGYDALDEEINHGEMMAVINETSDQIDLANYNLGQEGLMAILQTLMVLPRITKLNLASNGLNDSAVTYLCYYLEKGNRTQLRELNLSGNSIGKTGAKALKGLKNIFEKVQILGVKL